MKARTNNSITVSAADIQNLADYLSFKLKDVKKLSDLNNGRLFFTEAEAPEKEKKLLKKLDPIFERHQFTELLTKITGRWPNTITSAEIEKIRIDLLDTFLNDLSMKTSTLLAANDHKVNHRSFQKHFTTAFMFAVIAKQSHHFIADSTLKLKLNVLKKITLFNQSSLSTLEGLNAQFHQTINQKLLFSFSANSDKKTLIATLQELFNNSRQVETHSFIDHSGANLWSHLHGLLIYINLKQRKEFPYLQFDSSKLHIEATKWNFDQKRTETITESVASAIYAYINQHTKIEAPTINAHAARVLLEMLNYLDSDKKSNSKQLNKAKNKLDAVITKAAQEKRVIKLEPEFKVTFSNGLFAIKQQRSISDPQLVSPRISPKNQS